MKKERLPRKIPEYLFEVIFFAGLHLLLWFIYFMFFDSMVLDKLGMDVQIAGRETVYKFGTGFFEYTYVLVLLMIFLVLAIILGRVYREKIIRLLLPFVLHACVFAYHLHSVYYHGFGRMVREFFFQMQHGAFK